MLDIDARLGQGHAQGFRLAKLVLQAEAELDRQEPVTRVRELRVGRFEADGAIDAMRHLPLALHANGTATADRIDANVIHLMAADTALLRDVTVAIEAPADGPLAITARSLVDPARGGRAVHDGVARLPCTLGTVAGSRLLKLDLRLAGREPALLRGLVAQGFVTADAVRIDDLQLHVGRRSGLAGRFVVTAADRNRDKTTAAHIDGCAEGSLQTRPMASSAGEELQGFLLPALQRLSQGEADMFRIGVHGQLGIGDARLAGRAPIKLGIERWGSGSGGRADAFTVEVDRLDLVVPPPGARRQAMRLSLGRLTLQDGQGTLSFSGPPATPLLALEHAPAIGQVCDSRAAIRAELRTERIDRLDIATVRRVFDRLSALAKGDAPGSRLCNPLALHVVAGDVAALPELIETLTAIKRPADAPKLPRLRNLDVELSIATDRTLTYAIKADVLPPGGTVATCRAETPGVRPPPRAGPANSRSQQGFAAGGTIRIDKDRGQWQGAIGGEFTCIDLADTVAIAAAAGLELHNPAVDLKAGRIDRLTYALDIPPSASLSDLSQGTGWLDWSGALALSVTGTRASFAVNRLHLGALTEAGLPLAGSLRVERGSLSGLERDEIGRNRRGFPRWG